MCLQYVCSCPVNKQKERTDIHRRMADFSFVKNRPNIQLKFSNLCVCGVICNFNVSFERMNGFLYAGYISLIISPRSQMKFFKTFLRI